MNSVSLNDSFRQKTRWSKVLTIFHAQAGATAPIQSCREEREGKGDLGPVATLDNEFSAIYMKSLDDATIQSDNVLSLYEQSCRKWALVNADTKPEEARMNIQEANTWLLIRKLFAQRASRRDTQIELLDNDVYDGSFISDDYRSSGTRSKNFLRSDASAFSEIMKHKNVAEVFAVKKWLEETSPQRSPIEVLKDPYVFTRSRIRTKKPYESVRIKMGFGAGASSLELADDQIVTELDPDAPNRQQKRLAPEDQNYEAVFVRMLFDYLRQGRLREAYDLCIECNHHWRAISIIGGEYREDEFLDGTINENFVPIKGNENRMLWKAMCYQIALDENLNPHERALYAVLSGDVNNAASVCTSWEDHAWVRFSALLETLISKELAKAPTLFSSYQELNLPIPQFDMAVTEIFESLTRIDDKTVQDQSQEPFRVIQAHIICDSTNLMFEMLSLYLNTPSLHPTALNAIHLAQTLRFCTHLIFYLLNTGMSKNTDATDLVLTEYIQVLQDLNNSDLIPMVVQCLPSRVQTEVYSEFLSGMDDGSREIDCRHYINLGRIYGLDMQGVCKEATRLIFRRGGLFDAIIDYKAINGKTNAGVPAVDIHGIKDHVPEADMIMIRGLSWLEDEPTQLEQYYKFSNHLLRWLLLQGRVQSVAAFFRYYGTDARVSPPDTVPSPYLVSLTEEHMHISLLLDCFNIRTSWQQLYYIDRPDPDSRQMLQWTAQLKSKTLEYLNKLEHLTQNDIMFIVDRSGGDPQTKSQTLREIELDVLRVIYLPEIVMWRHEALFETREYIPGNLEKSLELATVIISGTYREIKRAGRLREFLLLMGKSATELLGVGKTLLSKSDLSST